MVKQKKKQPAAAAANWEWMRISTWRWYRSKIIMCAQRQKKMCILNIIEIPQMNASVEWHAAKTLSTLGLKPLICIGTLFCLCFYLLLRWWWIHSFYNVKQTTPDHEMVNWKWNPIRSMKGSLVDSNKKWFGQWIRLLKWMNNFINEHVLECGCVRWRWQ